ncbi:galactosylgalactosylxylosylprotein 3-beta-glucuronosyltransferase P-like [Homalodisca vitripennis]|uniref:galactosylgalactosylxylosylprotein 3-beta-glucuronosyltransferase P-like n=1 Tax=Homalodisca vitripennis TaxID=197043 RepID=UPI001EEBAAB3|nr:galactosylgalactosylxylosylprotein 3-beta-glucuronosyltransferase P-like [Homalodisca vitripennis]XP_046683734.1 galactosylgalactosylxylosylprotein 3-beta-glucuronosyltransferase P-like [Homalodisca vitripennis]
MKLSRSRKMWLVMVICAGLVVAQYQLASSWLITTQQPQPLSETMQTAIDQLQIDDSVMAAVGERVIRDIALQISQKLSSEICTSVVDSELQPVSGKQTDENGEDIPTLYIITPTYRRPEQLAELTRLAQTLMHIPKIHWLVIEDSRVATPQVTQLLLRTGLSFEHLIAPMPDIYKNKTGSKPRGVSNRNRGLKWLRANATKGVFYFADDDNTYDIALFQEMRFTERVSMWPVGLCTNFGMSTPIVRNGSLTGFYDGWIAGRKFPVDMAGFAVNVKFLLQRPKATMPYKPGFEEDGFLRSLAPFEPKDIELRADNCTKILVWHTQTKKNKPAVVLDIKKYRNTNLIHLRHLIV